MTEKARDALAELLEPNETIADASTWKDFAGQSQGARTSLVAKSESALFRHSSAFLLGSGPVASFW
jgi:hypothetical protein